MSPRTFSPPAAVRAAMAAGAAGLALLATPAAAAEVVIFDARGDFLPTYVGEQRDDLDISIADARIQGSVLHLASVQHRLIEPGSTFVWGIDRGAGTEGFLGGSPSLGAGVTFDAIIALRGHGGLGTVTGSVTTFGPGGPVTTDISAKSFLFDQVIGAYVPLSLLPSTGFAAPDYRVNLWTRDGPGNGHIADFAVDNGTFAVNPVPEPTTWALLIAGFGMAGSAIRRRRALANA